MSTRIPKTVLRPSPAGYVERAAGVESVDLSALTPLPRSFYDRATRRVAKALLGMWLVHVVDGTRRIGRIVEVEAYLGPTDQAAHTSHGKTARTQAMFGPPGHAYVYFVYGMHHCMNVVTEGEGVGTAVLLRALEPIASLSTNTNGPARLCKAMGITLADYGRDLLGDALFVAEPAPGLKRQRGVKIVACPRIGVDYAGAWAAKPLRFYLEGSPFVSRK